MYNDYNGDTDINPKIRPLPQVCEKTCFKGGTFVITFYKIVSTV